MTLKFVFTQYFSYFPLKYLLKFAICIFLITPAPQKLVQAREGYN